MSTLKKLFSRNFSGKKTKKQSSSKLQLVDPETQLNGHLLRRYNFLTNNMIVQKIMEQKPSIQSFLISSLQAEDQETDPRKKIKKQVETDYAIYNTVKTTRKIMDKQNVKMNFHPMVEIEFEEQLQNFKTIYDHEFAKQSNHIKGASAFNSNTRNKKQSAGSKSKKSSKHKTRKHHRK